MNSVDVFLTARGDQVKQPWIWRLSREFELKVYIEKANVDEDFGWMHVRLEGPIEEIQRATAWLMTTGMHVQTEQRAVGA